MKRPVAVLLLLLTTAAAVQYGWQATVSLPGPAVQTTSAVSKFVCTVRCEVLSSEECSGFTFEAGDGTCRLFSGDCRGPAANSSQQTADHYMGRSHCPGTTSNPCDCPAGFSRCAGRCLARLDRRVNYTQAETLCAERGAHLAVPRSEAENQCAVTATAGTGVWLGFTDVITEGRFIGADGCGHVPSDDPSWASGQPNNVGNQDYAALFPPSVDSPSGPGWNDVYQGNRRNPLCQLSLCYESGCQ